MTKPSFRANINFINDFNNEFNHDIVILTETWLNDDSSSVIAELMNNSYCFQHTREGSKTGGGVGILYSK